MSKDKNNAFLQALLPTIHLLQEYWSDQQELIVDSFHESEEDNPLWMHDVLMHAFNETTEALNSYAIMEYIIHDYYYDIYELDH